MIKGQVCGPLGNVLDVPALVLVVPVLVLPSRVLADVTEGETVLVALPPVVLAVEVEEVVVEALAVEVVAGVGARRRRAELEVGVFKKRRALKS